MVHQEAEVRYKTMTFRFIVAHPEDVIQKKLLAGRFFEEDELALFENFGSGGTALDIGANVGNHTVFFAALGGFGRVVPFEPNPTVYTLLQANVAANDLSNVDLGYLGFALGSQDGQGVLRLDEGNLGATQVNLVEGGDIQVRDAGRVLADMHDIDLIKIDVEGMEIEVLKSIGKLLERERPPIYIEISLTHERAFSQWCATSGYRVAQTVSQRKYKRNVMLRHQEDKAPS